MTNHSINEIQLYSYSKGGNNHEITKEKFTPPVKRRGNGKSLRF